MPGRPLSAFSMGMLIALSASTAERPPVRVRTDTCTVVTSGMASTGSREAAVTPELNLVDDLGVDSLSKCELAIALERAFNTLISDADVEEMQTVSDVSRVVERRLLAA